MYLKEKKTLPMAGGIFLAAITVFYEVLLHIWCGSSVTAAQMIPVTLFGLGFGSILAVIACLIPSPTAEKWFASSAALLLAVIYMTEYCLNECFRSFMTPKTILGGAGGVATGFTDVIITLLTANLWKILLVLLPIVLFILFVHPRKGRWMRSGLFAGIALIAYLAGFLSLRSFSGDLGSLTDRFNFDGSIRTNGLSISMIMEISGMGTAAQKDSFEQVSIPVPVITQEEPTVPENTEPPRPHVLEGLDFDTVGYHASGSFANLCNYLSTLTPSTDNPYTGLFAGKNLIFISAEAFTAEVIDPERTPTLYRMATKGIHFTDYYQPVWNGGTSGGEVANLSGLVPWPSGGMGSLSNQKPFITMGHQLQKLGYFSRAYHNNSCTFYDRNVTHENLGYDKFIAMFSGMEEGVKNEWPQSDLEMIDFTVPQFIDQQPFSIYYMSVSGHSLYTLEGNAQARKNYSMYENTDYSEPVKCYLAAQQELEKAMESLIRQLEEAGIADDTVIVISPDHYPYGLDAGSAWHNDKNYVCELFGIEDGYDNFTRDHNAAIIWSGCLEGMNLEVNTPTSALDLLPTLDNLFDIDYDSRLLVGRDVFSDAAPLVLWPDHSWITDAGRYNAQTREFTPAEGVTVPEDYVKNVSAVVQNKINYSHTAISDGFFRLLEKKLNQPAQ